LNKTKKISNFDKKILFFNEIVDIQHKPEMLKIIKRKQLTHQEMKMMDGLIILSAQICNDNQR